MSWEQIGSGSILDTGDLKNLERSISEGQKGMLELDLRVSPGQSIIDELQSQLQAHGVTEAKVTSGSPILRIEYRKGFPWVAVIVAIILVLAILIIGWRFFREIVQSVGPAIAGGILIAGVIGLVLLSVAIAKRRLR
jgi:hypothetical protein